VHRPSPLSVARSTLAGVVVVGVIYSTSALLAPLPAADPVVLERESVSTPEATVSLPGYGASAIGPRDARGAIYAGNDPDTSRPIASITKVVTALVVLERHPLGVGEAGPVVTLDEAAGALDEQYQAINGSIAPAREGLQLTQRQLIDLTLVWSANNYADTLAIWAFGSVDEYLDAARAWLAEQGLNDITLADATGLLPGSAATPRALLDLARIALANPVIADSVGALSIDVPGVGEFPNRNTALGLDGITGMKTGTTREAGACLLFTATTEVDGQTVDMVGVVLGAGLHAEAASDSRTLVRSAMDDYRTITVAEAGEVVARWHTPWGAETALQVADTTQPLIWGPALSQTFVPLPAIAPGRELPAAPSLIVQLGRDHLTVPLVWSSPLDGPDPLWRLLRPLRDWGIIDD
jgi:serine-type D-Ala-D-Ala carboxypeptidase (penicillin-binding protein 5/6)